MIYHMPQNTKEINRIGTKAYLIKLLYRIDKSKLAAQQKMIFKLCILIDSVLTSVKIQLEKSNLQLSLMLWTPPVNIEQVQMQQCSQKWTRRPCTFAAACPPYCSCETDEKSRR